MRPLKTSPSYRWMTSRKLGYFLCVVGFLWGITLMNMTLVNYNARENQHQLKEEIVKLSEQYVKSLAKETKDTIDGPYAGRLTGYDLKKTMAVLLDNIMERLEKLEKQVNNATLTRQLVDQQQDVNNPPGPRSPLMFQKEDENSPAVPQINLFNDAEAAVNAKNLIMGQQEDCTISDEQNKEFPHCRGKIAWMTTHWRSDPCYAAYGVDGSECSFRIYLSEVEHWCPSVPGRHSVKFNNTEPSGSSKKAKINTNLEGLLSKLQDPGQRRNYEWIRRRIRMLWPRWMSAIEQLQSKHSGLSNRVQKRVDIHLGLLSRTTGFRIQERTNFVCNLDLQYQQVVVHLGLLTKASGWKFAEKAFKGGPLGELVQWSDIISALYILGHDLVITSEVEQLQSHPAAHYTKNQCPMKTRKNMDLIITDIMGLRQFRKVVKSSYSGYRILAQFPNAEAQCQSREKLPVHMIFTDIVGLSQFKRKVKNGYGKFSCLLRIVDSFGTEPAFNYEPYAKTHRMKTQWGMQNLNPQQFYTMFPHSPDNSFMGFVVDNHINKSNAMYDTEVPRKNQALVYGKAEYMWDGKAEYLKIIREYVDIHATVFLENGHSQVIPDFVKNHGILPGVELHELLRQSKLFIGLGFPYEGPAPLEAVAQGAIFINPKFSPPHNSANTKFFKGKPTLRKLTSQHPYAEEFIGEPHVFTVDIHNEEELRRTLEAALKAHNLSKVQPYLPYEYTEEGLLQRLDAYISHQDFCSPFPMPWPEDSAITVLVSQKGQSCKDTCMKEKLICEPSHFKRINQQSELEKHVGRCSSVASVEDIYFPAFNPKSKQCILQKEPMLFSCVGEHPDFSRLCPCRSYIEGQTALCTTCL